MDFSLFHGSNMAVKAPEIRIAEYTKDFGYGFYCTNLYGQAEKWALRHGIKDGTIPTVNIYRYSPNKELNVKVFDGMSDEWLDFIALCRKSKEKTPHNYDIVEGPMADDEVWNYVEDFLSGEITREQFWVLAAFRHPTHQLSFHSAKALQCLTFERMVVVEHHN